MSDKTTIIIKRAPTLADLAPTGVDGRIWVKVLKEQLLSARSDGLEPSNEELLFFARTCQASGLDPALRQIYGIYRNVKQKDGTYKPKLTIQTSIDGFRTVAEKSGNFGGSKEPEFIYDPDIKISVNASGTEKLVPNKAKVTVLKVTGERVLETTRTANWADYFPGDREGNMWKKFPETMLSKVAEAQALRAAFPNCGNLYLAEEMQTPDEADAGTDMEAVAKSIKTAETLDALFEIVTGLPVDQQKQVAELATVRTKELQDES